MANKAPKRMQDLTMENVRLVARNFSGMAKKFNDKGKRNFLALIEDEETAQAMLLAGWNVKYLPAREEGDVEKPFLKVNVNFDNEPLPRHILITSRGQTTLDEETCGMIDGFELTNVDLLVTPYHYERNGEPGVSAYLRKGYFTIKEDALDLKYGVNVGNNAQFDGATDEDAPHFE